MTERLAKIIRRILPPDFNPANAIVYLFWHGYPSEQTYNPDSLYAIDEKNKEWDMRTRRLFDEIRSGKKKPEDEILGEYFDRLRMQQGYSTPQSLVQDYEAKHSSLVILDQLG